MIELPSSRRSLMWFLQFQQFYNQRKWRLIFSQNSISAISNGSYIFDSAQRAVMTADSSFLYPGSINLHPALISSLTLTLRYNSFSVGFYPVSRIFQENSPSIWWKNFNAMIVLVWKSGNTGKLYLLLMKNFIKRFWWTLMNKHEKTSLRDRTRQNYHSERFMSTANTFIKDAYGHLLCTVTNWTLIILQNLCKNQTCCRL